ncbi:MAG: penicillin-binding protein [Solirubrobacteraceae bacterium]|jgi:penicillin-binding protein 1A|nr:penicillin-binding protein [Solirubrobacteraceae bacterium]
MSDENGSNITPLFGDDQPIEPPARVRPRVKKLRLLAILGPLALLAIVSAVFGMLMAVASDLPALENRKEYQDARNSVLTDVHGKVLGVLTNNQSRVLVGYEAISPYMRNAIIAIEDRRFYENSGVDLRGIGRALLQDIENRKAIQGGSTIAQQFVKNALRAQGDRTILQKLREAALAYHLTRKWPKNKILTQYLNSIYFGNGAYGVESAARTYFGQQPDHQGCGDHGKALCVSQLKPDEAALIAGVVANPSAYDPVAHPQAAKRRRDLVLRSMFQQGRLTRLEYFNARQEALPAAQDIKPPTVNGVAPYFTTWVRQQLVDRFGARRAFEGGLTVKTTLDLQLQQAAENAVNTYFSNPDGPSAALVAIDNDSGQVRAMVGGRDYAQRPFNLATQGQRQPGSSMKPFILAAALRQGMSPGSLWPSRKRVFTVPGTRGREKFVVNNFESKYAGTQTLAGGLTYSDNAVYSAVGIQVGTKRIARLARRMGIRTPVSSNYAMTLGGLKHGVSPLDMAHAYETFIEHGRRISGTLGSTNDGPVGIDEVNGPNGTRLAKNKPVTTRVLPASIADQVVGIMGTVVTQGTARRAALADGQFAAGKTGTTENDGDAWFVGFTQRMTVAVWVGYPDKLKPMLTEFAGQPVEGGTYPALVWHDFMTAANQVLDDRAAQLRIKQGLPPKPQTTPTSPVPPTSVPAKPAPVPEGGASAPPAPTATTTTPPSGGTGTGTSTTPTTPTTPATPATPPAPTPPPTTTTTPPPTAPPSGGTGAGGAGAATEPAGAPPPSP